MPGVWSEWSRDAFKGAAERGLPVLLYIRAFWCTECDLLERAITELAPAITSSSVPILVDGELRPDIAARYLAGGYPTLGILDNKGRPITLFGPRDVFSALSNISSLLSRLKARVKGADISFQEPKPSRYSVEELIDSALISATSAFDSFNGGFGGSIKYHYTELLQFLLEIRRLGRYSSISVMLDKTLSSIQKRRIVDANRGCFFWVSETPDWNKPKPEFLAEVNAALAAVYAEHYASTSNSSSRKASDRIIECLFEYFYDKKTGLFSSSAKLSENGEIVVSKNFYLSKNSQIVYYLLRASLVLGDNAALDKSLSLLDNTLKSFTSKKTLMHTVSKSGIVFLEDYSWLLSALIRAYQITFYGGYLDRAQIIAESMLSLFNAPNGSLYDVPFWHEKTGLLKHRLTPLIENAIAATSLAALSYIRGQTADRAKTIISVLADAYHRYGLLTSSLALAALLVEKPIIVTASSAKLLRDPLKQCLRVIARKEELDTPKLDLPAETRSHSYIDANELLAAVRESCAKL